MNDLGQVTAGAARRTRAVNTVIAIAAAGLAAAGCAPAHSAPSGARPPASSPAASFPAPGGGPHGALTARISGITGSSVLAPGGPWLRFTVTAANAARRADPGLALLVSLGPCGCTPSRRFPAGTLQERSAAGPWTGLFYDTEGSGRDYLDVAQQPGLSLAAGASAIFRYRLRLRPASSAQVTRGAAAIDVTLLALPAHQPLSAVPAARALVEVLSGTSPG
jgi:hypothetical protein